jgi:AraC-like DNA-binding protein
VHRHLAESGETFTSVLNSTRVGLAERLVADDRYSLTEIGEMLAFSTPNSFSRWFRQQFGVSARVWRAQAKEEGEPKLSYAPAAQPGSPEWKRSGGPR